MAQVWAAHDWLKPAVGQAWQNTRGRILFQWHCNFANSCGRCIEMAGAIGRWWPLPLHRGCRCSNVPIRPGEVSAPGLDYREEVRKLDPVQQTRVIGAANLKLVEAGLVEWGQVVDRTRIKTLRQVIDERRLTPEQLRGAGVPEATIRAALADLNTPAVELAARRRETLVAALQGRGLTREQLRTEIGRRLAARVGIRRPSDGMGGPPVPPVPPAPPIPGLADLPAAVLPIAVYVRDRISDDSVPKPGQPRKIAGPTPDGGSHAVVTVLEDGSWLVVEIDAQGDEIRRTIVPPLRRPA